MQFLTDEQCRDWAEARGYGVGGVPRYRELLNSRAVEHRFSSPADAGRRVALIRYLWEKLMAGEPEVLLWVTDWSVWPSGEHLPLAQDLRSAHGETRHLEDAPGHLFQLGETTTAISFAVLACLFLWDAYALSPSGQRLFMLSHDEIGLACCPAEESESLMRGLRELGALDESRSAS
jgi:hypothetical protein